MAKDKDLIDSMEKAQALPPRRKLAPPRKEAASDNVARSLSPGEVRRAAKQAVVADAFAHEVAVRVGLLGSGQGGGRIAQAFWDLGYRRVGAFNTTDSDFDGLAPEMPKFFLGIGGAQKDARMALQAVQGCDQDVYDLMARAFGKDVDCVLVCASLGGGTGSGTAAYLVEYARRYMADAGRPPRVGAVVSLPGRGEGQRQARNAVWAFRELLRAKASPLIVIDNARVSELYRPGMLHLYPTANRTVAELFHLFNRRAAVHSDLITFDRSEFVQLLDGGIVTMAAADIDVAGVESPADVSTRVREELANNVLAGCDLRKGRKAACLFIGHTSVLEEFPADYFEAGYSQLNRIVGAAYPDKERTPTVVHRGLYSSEEEGLQCYTMVAELEPPFARLNELAREAGLPADKASVNSVAAFLGVD